MLLVSHMIESPGPSPALSTGGPATNVTWRKDGVAIDLNQDYEQTQIVTDTMSGTYQNMLTIAPFVTIGKMYGCSVGNDKGASNTANVSGNCCNCSKSVIYCCTESFSLCKWRGTEIAFPEL